MAADSKGNIIIADSNNFLIRKLSLDGCVSTIAGTGKYDFLDGKALEAKFGQCYGVAVDSNDTIYVTDYSNHVIRIIRDGSVSTLAGKPGQRGKKDGKGEDALFNNPHGICMDSKGFLLVADNGNCCLRRVSTD